MAKFQFFQYLFRPVMENQIGLPAEEFLAVKKSNNPIVNTPSSSSL